MENGFISRNQKAFPLDDIKKISKKAKEQSNND